MKALLGFGIDLCDVCEKIKNTARVTPLVIVPGDKLDEVLVEGDTGLGIEDRGVVITVHVGGDDIIFSISEYA